MAKTRKKAKRPVRARGPRSSRGTSRSFSALFSALTRAYGRRRRPAAEDALDKAVLAVLTEGLGERAALRLVSRFKGYFVDWNEVRVARPRDIAIAAPDAPEGRVKKMQALLQALYEGLGGLDLGPLLELKPTEARVLLTKLGVLGREEVDAIMMVAMGLPVMPGSEDLARVLRRMGVVPRKATRARAQRAALKGVSPEQYRDFYGLGLEHAASVCHAQVPDCTRCKLKRSCKSKGRW
jgi:endonuclease III